MLEYSHKPLFDTQADAYVVPCNCVALLENNPRIIQANHNLQDFYQTYHNACLNHKIKLASIHAEKINNTTIIFLPYHYHPDDEPHIFDITESLSILGYKMSFYSNKSCAIPIFATQYGSLHSFHKKGFDQQSITIIIEQILSYYNDTHWIITE